VWGNNRKSEASRTGADGDSAASGTEPSNVGRYLKAQREARGEDIPHVADMLRIHRAYLQAIEENEIDKLPGPTYAVGFVRAYAEHLGLDSRQIVERFKEEGKVLDKRAQLVFPSPLPEGRVPSAAIMLLAFVFLLAAYGGWVYVSSSNDGGVDMVPSLPDRFAALVGGEDAPAAKAKPPAQPAETAEPAQPAQTEQAPTPVETAPETAPAPVTTEADSKVATSTAPLKPAEAGDAAAPANTEAAKTDSSVPAESSAPAADSSGGSAPSTEAQASAADASSEEARKPAENPTPAPTTETAAPAATAARPAGDDLNAAAPTTGPDIGETAAGGNANTASVGSSPPTPPVAEADDAPRVFGEPGEGSRVTVRAVVDSWVEIQASDGELLLTRVLRAGDLYHVPARPGLTLVTGNAGGLAFSVDGAKVPDIGPMGTVRRNVSLDPDALKNGTAHTR